MTNAIEQTKREMYRRVSTLKWACNEKPIAFEQFETALEAYLEELRKGLVAANSVTVDCAQHSAESFVELERRLAAMTEERDSIQLRLHAVDHAYSEQQSKAGTCGQVCGDRGARERLDGNTVILIGALRESQRIMIEYLVPDGIRAKRAMTKMIPFLDNEALYAAMAEFEHEKA